MTKKYYHITLALAGICQATYLVQQVARYGDCNIEALQTSLNSLLNLNPPSILDIFGKKESNLHYGLETLIGLLNGRSDQGLRAEVTQYTMSLMLLERKLQSTQGASRDLANRIHKLNTQYTNSTIELNVILGLMADIYLDVISPLGPRIQVMGSADILKNIQVQHKIRTLLLAGIRSVVLWQQVGGRRWQLMFLRNHLISQSKLILKLGCVD
ncbi:High frequency lysogenization protein HflD [Candidatus Erwinia haradaeae]|uniref:High frequency lysogenization protein HflD homolog n=1 Tax=Candidatus Erwinia haradaeae TaxID=1922217 RepID=A0A451DDJ2_9GAMM|nr:high frequency lysogenization protein HflD [Candidatus Erwinia haradaeae]VFP84553.1 High frequency lysogenization protein HflD [Candidatus Erwinia haradaeae]